MSSRTSLRVAALAVVAWLLWSGIAAAQEVDPYVADLRNYDVTFDSGADLSQGELNDLDRTTAKLQDGDGYFKVVVLEKNVDDFDSAIGFADAVRSGLGGKGRVLVLAPNEVALSSNLDSKAEASEGEQAAANALNAGDSDAQATAEAAAQLGSDISGAAEDAVGGNGGGKGGAWAFLLILLLPLALLVGFMWWTSRRMKARAEEASKEQVGAAEAKVRDAVNKVANDLLELSDRIDQPTAPPEAKAAFTQGADLFTTAQELLESADTRPELENAYPKVVDAGWQLDTARALLDGQPAPPKPEPDDLFPKPVIASTPAPAEPAGMPVPTGADAGAAAPPTAARPEPHYRSSGLSPWLTSAAMAAITMLSQRGMSVPKTRPSMDEGTFGNWSSGLPPLPSSGGGRRGGGSRRRGGPVVPSSQGRRGVARR